MNEPDFGYAAFLAGEPARAAMLAALFDGRTMPAGQLAKIAGVTPATASAHLARLVEGGLLRVRSQGRHRYYEFSGPHIAHALEALGAIARATPVRSLGESLRSERLRFARSCYNHIAGELALIIVGELIRMQAIEPDDLGFRLTPSARSVFLQIGIDTRELFADPHAHIRGCIDWTQRRAHIAGPLGSRLLQAFLTKGIVRRRDEPRVLELTQEGRSQLKALLGIDLTADETIAS